MTISKSFVLDYCENFLKTHKRMNYFNVKGKISLYLQTNLKD